MAEVDTKPGRGVRILVVLSLLLVCNLVAANWGYKMWLWALEDMENQGERWGSMGIIFISFVSLPVMLLVLLPGTIIAAILARKRLPLGFGLLLVVPVAAGVLMNVAALVRVHRTDQARAEELKRTKIVYTSGLYDAVTKGDTGAAELILKRNPEAIKDDPLDRSLLDHAICNNDLKMVELLLNYGAQVRKGGTTPLHVAAECGNIPIADILLVHGADINAEDSDFMPRTPLAYAQKAGKTAMAEFLESKGARVANVGKKASGAQ